MIRWLPAEPTADNERMSKLWGGIDTFLRSTIKDLLSPNGLECPLPLAKQSI
jgi:hypothetical protein